MKLTASQLFYASSFKKPIRILKRIKHAVVDGDDIRPDEADSIRVKAEGLSETKPKKIGKVLRKIAKHGRLGVAVELMDKLGVLDHVLPEVAACKGVMQSPKTHQEGDVFTHIVLAAKNALSTVDGQFAALFHDIAKPNTRREVKGDVKFPGHDEAGADMARNILERLGFDEDLVETVETSVREHMRVHDLADAADDELKDFVDDVGEEEALDVINTSKADERGARPLSNHVEDVERRVKKLTE